MNSGLQLLDPKPLEGKNLNALAAGLSQPSFPYKFARLPGVKSELDQITKAGIKTTILLDKKFTSVELNRQINSTVYKIVHLATHGKFSSRAEDTYILAADGRINVREFNHILLSSNRKQEAIQLLTLSACQTAEGDKRAALGLAGAAIKAGARSTIASLWQIEDEVTAMFIGEFYRALTTVQPSKVEALRKAQLKLLHHPNYQAPFYWSPYVLIGNWL
jgi:CHAT domain-containing protein